MSFLLRGATAVCLSGLLALGGCLSPTPYHAASLTDPAHADGYHEVRLEPERWRVVFAGNALTSRETVETYLLYRAAELTLENGYDWFLAVERDTDANVTVTVVQEPGDWGPGWEPHWRYADGGRWPVWDRHGTQPDFDLRTVTAYEAFAEVVMGRGAPPVGDPRAFDARTIRQSLEGRIVRPGGRAR